MISSSESVPYGLQLGSCFPRIYLYDRYCVGPLLTGTMLVVKHPAVITQLLDVLVLTWKARQTIPLVPRRYMSRHMLDTHPRLEEKVVLLTTSQIRDGVVSS